MMEDVGVHEAMMPYVGLGAAVLLGYMTKLQLVIAADAGYEAPAIDGIIILAGMAMLIAPAVVNGLRTIWRLGAHARDRLQRGESA